jgi:hypothetical protein
MWFRSGGFLPARDLIRDRDVMGLSALQKLSRLMAELDFCCRNGILHEARCWSSRDLRGFTGRDRTISIPHPHSTFPFQHNPRSFSIARLNIVVIRGAIVSPPFPRHPLHILPLGRRRGRRHLAVTCQPVYSGENSLYSMFSNTNSFSLCSRGSNVCSRPVRDL